MNTSGQGNLHQGKEIMYKTKKGNTEIFVVLGITLTSILIISSLAKVYIKKTYKSNTTIETNNEKNTNHDNEAVVELTGTDTDNVVKLCVTNNEEAEKCYQVVDKMNTQKNIETEAEKYCNENSEIFSEVLSSEECIENYQKNNQ